VNASVKYTLGRIGLFLVVLAALLPVPVSLLVKLMIAVLVSALLAYFLLRGWRDEMAAGLAAGAQRRRAEKDRLRAALAGEDGSAGTDRPTGERADEGSAKAGGT
jgi:hypothetical protein